MANKKGLGRGLESLFDQNMDTTVDENLIIEIDLEDLEPNPFQPRKVFDENALEDLAKSIKAQGVLQPILVRKSIIGYEIISGERRFRATTIAGLKTIPAIVYDYNDKQMMEVGIIENIQREDLSVLEEAKSYQMLIDNLQLTQQEISDQVGKSRSHIANMLRLLKLDDNVLQLIDEGKISMGHAKVLGTIEDKEKVLEIAELAASQDLTVRAVEQMAKEQKEVEQPKAEKTTPVRTEASNEYKRLESILREKLDTSVKISGKNRGKLSIEFDSRDELERILEVLNIF